MADDSCYSKIQVVRQLLLSLCMILIFRMAAVQRLIRSVFIQWRVFCFMFNKNPLSSFGIERDMVKSFTVNIMTL